jgi:hypothetical protein
VSIAAGELGLPNYVDWTVVEAGDPAASLC